MTRSLTTVFSAKGPLAKTIDGYQPRDVQLEMAQAVETAIDNQQSLVVEAATGTGKTFAYGVPLFQTDEKVIVSTGTKNLQDQLFFRDLPILQTALGTHKTLALLKGRNNYICLQRLEQHRQAPDFFSPTQIQFLQQVQEFADKSPTGDLTQLDAYAQHPQMSGAITSTEENCLGKKCPFYDKCFILQARQKAQKADIVVVNHHLFCADLMLKDVGFGQLLPDAGVVVLDEAHHLPKILTDFFTETLSTRRIANFLKEVLLVVDQTAPEHIEDFAIADDIKALLQRIFESSEPAKAKGELSALLKQPGLEALLSELNDHWQSLLELLLTLSDADVEFKPLYATAQQMAVTFKHIFKPDHGDGIYWYERYPRSISFCKTPLDIAEQFGPMVNDSPQAWIFTSATLAVDHQFEFFKSQLGIEPQAELELMAPFDYATQALLYVPRGLPMPAAYDYTEQLMQATRPLLEKNQGRAFLLFTSFKALNQAAEYLTQHTRFALFIQGNAAKGKLLEQFVKTPHSVLLGTLSFWEGVDVKGEALSLVVIDKLPFRVPDDPVLVGRCEAIKAAGGEPFVEVQLPQAAITLKQGAGRLIRDIHDRGVLMIGDPRIATKGYGKLFVQSLPPFTRTRDPEQALAFFETEEL